MQEVGDFLRLAALESLLAQPAPAAAPDNPAGEDFDPGPGGTKVLCDGGMYFDTAKGVLVYLKNIRLTDPRFDLECRDELKVFLAKKPEKPAAAGAPATGTANGAPAPEPAPPAPPPAAPETGSADADGVAAADSTKLLGGDFGDIDRLMATGGVKVTRKDPQGQPIIATAETAVYERTSGDVILRGGLPIVRKGKDYLRALEPGLYIRLYANGDVFTQPGKWETGVSELNPQKGKPGAPR
jgi:hypothetical protein